MRPAVLLVAGPAGAGKTTTAERVAEHPDWVHVPEDDAWVRVKAGRPAGELRTAAEQEVVHEQVVRQVLDLVAAGRRVVVDLVLYEDPPRPLLRYRAALGAAGVPVATLVLRPDVEELLRRIERRARPGDARPGVRADAEHQVRVLSSPHLDPVWVVDTTHLSPDEVHERHVAPLLELTPNATGPRLGRRGPGPQEVSG